ncbi:MAG TPA: efflux RND transporter periplasmic adaptor subunit [Bacteroidales bacterium]|nr:efflux RND transporter periplasmic adaptor subunit [Bacteroidales bacterium]
MNKHIFLPSLIISAVLLNFSCRSKPLQDNNSDASLKHSGDTVILGRDYLSRNKIITEKAGFQKYTFPFTVPGVVKPLTGQLAEISAPYEGRLTASYVRLGQQVSKGSPIFGLASPDYYEAVKNFQQSAKEKEVAQRNYNRKKELSDQGVLSKKDFDDASLALDVAQKEYEKAGANLKIFNIDPETADFTRPLIISSPISGEVVSLNLTLGQYLKSDSDPVAVVANLDKVWVVAHIKEKDLGKINLRDMVDVFTESLPDKPFKGTVEYLGNILEDQTRSMDTYIECANSERLIKPGMFVSVRFMNIIENALIIPSTAILQDEDRTYLFLKLSDNVFVRRTVTAASLENHKMLVTSGITNGDEIVYEGGIYLR